MKNPDAQFGSPHHDRGQIACVEVRKSAPQDDANCGIGIPRGFVHAQFANQNVDVGRALRGGPALPQLAAGKGRSAGHILLKTQAVT